MFVFDPILAIVIFILMVLPSGILLGLSLFKNKDWFPFEKIVFGSAISLVLIAALPFLLSFLTIKFNFYIAIFSVLSVFAGSAYLFYREKPEIPQFDKSRIKICVFLVLLLLISFLIRFATHSPVFMELDPYYYTYVATQILTLGENPFNDQTAWYPVAEVDHRQVPLIGYWEAIWYSLYKGSTEYDNLLLSSIAALYPPIAAVFTAFFIYFLVYQFTNKREFGLIGGYLFTSTPVLIQKMFSGVMEVQPYAFFSISLFLVSIYLFFKERTKSNLALLFISIFAVTFGSNSLIFISALTALFLVLYAIYKRTPDKEIMSFTYSLVASFSIAVVLNIIFTLKINLIIFLIPILSAGTFIFALNLLNNIQLPHLEYGPLAGTVLLLLLIILDYLNIFSIPLAFNFFWVSLLIYGISNYKKEYLKIAILISLALPILSLPSVAERVPTFTGLGIVSYKIPLERTIAELGLAPTNFDGSLGVVHATANTVASHIVSFLPSGTRGSIIPLIASILDILFLPFTIVGNLLFSIFAISFATLFNITIDLPPKDNMFLFIWLVGFLTLFGYKLVKKEEIPEYLLLFSLFFPSVFVGLIKAKYTIYAGFTLAIILPILLNEAAKRINKTQILYFGVFLVVLSLTFSYMVPSLTWAAFQPVFYNDPAFFQEKLAQACELTGDTDICDASKDPINFASESLSNQFNPKLCMATIFSNPQYLLDRSLAPAIEQNAASFKCAYLSPYWLDSMEWISKNTEKDAVITSWWDYGHWINFFGNRNALIRNEHKVPELQMQTAAMFLDATPEELKEFMLKHNSKYVLFDGELILSGGSLGGKYGALNYLSCAWNNRTGVSNPPGASECEKEQLWEVILISSEPCTISEAAGRKGNLAYYIYSGEDYLFGYPPECMQGNAPGCSSIRLEPVYCVGDAVLADGSKTSATYKLNETNQFGDLVLNKAFLVFPYNINTIHVGPATIATLFYTEDPVWLENSTISSGFNDAKRRFYRSNLYRGFFLESLPGFELVYKTKDGMVKIYKVKE